MLVLKSNLTKSIYLYAALRTISYYYIDTDEYTKIFLLLKNHIFIVRSEDTIFIFHL